MGVLMDKYKRQVKESRLKAQKAMLVAIIFVTVVVGIGVYATHKGVTISPALFLEGVFLLLVSVALSNFQGFMLGRTYELEGLKNFVECLDDMHDKERKKVKHADPDQIREILEKIKREAQASAD